MPPPASRHRACSCAPGAMRIWSPSRRSMPIQRVMEHFPGTARPTPQAMRSPLPTNPAKTCEHQRLRTVGRGGAASASGPFIGFVGLSKPDFDAPFTPCVEIGWRLAHASTGARATRPRRPPAGGRRTRSARSAWTSCIVHRAGQPALARGHGAPRHDPLGGGRFRPSEAARRPSACGQHVLYRLRRFSQWRLPPTTEPELLPHLRPEALQPLAARTGRGIPAG